MSGTIHLRGDDIWSSRTVQFRWLLENASARLEHDPEIVRVLEVASAVQGLSFPTLAEHLQTPILTALLEVAEEMSSGELAAFPDPSEMEAVYVQKARELAEMIREVLGRAQRR